MILEALSFIKTYQRDTEGLGGLRLDGKRFVPLSDLRGVIKSGNGVVIPNNDLDYVKRVLMFNAVLLGDNINRIDYAVRRMLKAGIEMEREEDDGQ